MSKYSALAKRKQEPDDAADAGAAAPDGPVAGGAESSAAKPELPAPGPRSQPPSVGGAGQSAPVPPAQVPLAQPSAAPQPEPAPPRAAAPAPASRGGATPPSAAAPKKVGKRSDPNYKTLGAYVNKDRIRAVSVRLAENGQELSDVVDALLQGWLEGRFRVEVPTRR